MPTYLEGFVRKEFATYAPQSKENRSGFSCALRFIFNVHSVLLLVYTRNAVSKITIFMVGWSWNILISCNFWCRYFAVDIFNPVLVRWKWCIFYSQVLEVFKSQRVESDCSICLFCRYTSILLFQHQIIIHIISKNLHIHFFNAKFFFSNNFYFLKKNQFRFIHKQNNFIIHSYSRFRISIPRPRTYERVYIFAIYVHPKKLYLQLFGWTEFPALYEYAINS